MYQLRVPLFAAICAVLCSAIPAFSQQSAAQDSVQWVKVQTKGSKKETFYGKLLSQNDSFLVLQTRHFDALSIPTNTISSISINTIHSVSATEYIVDNVHAPRYFVATNGHGLRKGEISYDNTMLFFNQFSYGLSDQFTLGAGFSSLIFVEGPFAYWLAPKYSIPLQKDKIALAVGGIHGQSFGMYEEENYSFSALYSQVTFGSRDANMTIGTGLVAARGQWQKPVFSCASSLRATRNVAILMEGYTLKNRYGKRLTLVGMGLRLMGRRVALDAGVAASKEENYGPSHIPYGSLHIVLGRPKI